MKTLIFIPQRSDFLLDEILRNEYFFKRVFHFSFFVSACIASRPGQCGRADGYILEGKELEFYLRKVKAKKGK